MLLLLVFFISQTIFFLWLAISINKIRDTLLIRQEVLTEALAFTFGVALLLVAQIHPNPSGSQYMVSMMIIIPGLFTYPLAIAITSAWVYYQMRMRNITFPRGHYRSRTHDSMSYTEKRVLKRMFSCSNSGRKRSAYLSNILMDKDGLELFAEHLIKFCNVHVCNVIFIF